ncbi:MAG: hypothetical protein ABSA41_13180 [Terriglobia bacterium]|jgi:drug/metabolite transporter (DMT)-like permease
MTPPKTFSAKTFILVTLLVVFGSAGNLLFSAGMKQIGPIPDWSTAALHAVAVKVFASLWIWLGITSMLLFLAAFLLVLSWADFSYVLPATASMYVFIPLLGHFLLGESVTILRWLGVALICLGVVLVGRTPANTTKKD